MIGPRMLPAEIPPAVRDDRKRRAEVQVYERLRGDPLLAGFTVYYSCWWMAEHNGMLRDGEADFIAAHPDFGFIAIEVKGGVVSRRSSDSSWWSRGEGGVLHPIQDPVAQARKSKKVLLELLKREWVGKSPFVWARHGVILPHSARPTATPHLGAALPLDIFAFEEDMPTLGARLMQMLLWRPVGSNETVGGLGTQGVAILDRLFGEDFDLQRDLAAEISWSDRQIVELTDQQKRILEILSLQKHALIIGGAGTGKSVLAIEKAKRLAREGQNVLLVCFNKPLSLRLRQEASAGESLTVESFHGCCTRIAESAGLRPSQQRAKHSKAIFFGEVLPRLLDEARGSIEPYDAVIIDEGQDFAPEWLQSLKNLAGDGQFVVFGDANQSIYNKCDLAAVLGVQPLLLCDNVRNTRQIFDVMRSFYRGPKQDSRGPEGPEVRWVELNEAGLEAVLRDQVNQLTFVEGIPAESIVVLTGCGVDDSRLAGTRRLGEHPITNASEPRAGHITLDSVYRFKGLDSSVVILTEMDGAPAEPELPYVALSRAKSLMIVIGRAATLTYLQPALAKSSSEPASIHQAAQ